jgi:hypothetical protein
MNVVQERTHTRLHVRWQQHARFLIRWNFLTSCLFIRWRARLGELDKNTRARLGELDKNTRARLRYKGFLRVFSVPWDGRAGSMGWSAHHSTTGRSAP